MQLFIPTFQVDECLEAIRECLIKGWTGLGFKTVEFEEAWKQYTGRPHAYFLNSATAGLHLAVKILKDAEGWAEGDEIISTPLTFVSTNHAVAYEKMKVVFADVDEYLCLDPEDIERKITDRTRAVIFVGLGGNIGRWPQVVDLAGRRGLKIILDAAHMSGTRFNGQTACPEADVIVYSYQAVKNLPTADSGMVCFADPGHDQTARKLGWLGINKDTYTRTASQGAYKWKYEVDDVGFKYHGKSIMAAIALVQLKYLDRDNAYRRQLAGWYDFYLKGRGDLVRPVPVAPGCESSRHLYVIETAARDELMMALNECGIYPGVHYRDNTEYSMFSYGRGSCPRAHALSERIMSLPIHLRMTHGDVQQVARQVLAHAKPLNHAS
jgi:dTDP-4-amino-4,6-dideoxygalactose transaminase